jgi:hypothetical protein
MIALFIAKGDFSPQIRCGTSFCQEKTTNKFSCWFGRYGKGRYLCASFKNQKNVK